MQNTISPTKINIFYPDFFYIKYLVILVEIQPLTRVPDTYSENGALIPQYSPLQAVSQTTILIYEPGFSI